MRFRRGMWRPIALAAAGAMLIGGASASPAGASTLVGQNFTPTAGCGPDPSTSLQTVSPGDQYVVPSDGVITAWSHESGASPPSLKLKVARPQGGTAFTIVGESALETMAAGTLNVFATRIPVRAGDVIGVFNASGGQCQNNSAAGYALRFALTDIPPGTTADFSGASATAQLDVAAVLEPDCDGDGLGDETQDPAVDCVAPDTVITKGPPPKTRRRKATFEFTASEPGSRFQCRIDGGQFFACGSPLGLLKVKKGNHTFEVRSRDSAGNFDPEPAASTWLVKKKKRKRKK